MKNNKKCPLCNLTDREKDNVYYEDDVFFIARTKTLKGHKERIMIGSKLHIDKINAPYTNGIWWGNSILPKNIIDTLENICKEVFSYTYKVVVMEGGYASIPEHFHLVITDLEPDSDDFYQILGTRWLHVIDIKPWK